MLEQAHSSRQMIIIELHYTVDRAVTIQLVAVILTTRHLLPPCKDKFKT